MVNVQLMQAESPLTFSEEQDEVIKISGFAVHTGTFNDITVELAELDKAVKSLIGRPLLTNHKGNNVMSVVGKVTDARMAMDPKNGKMGIAYEADMDAAEKDLVRKMQLGFLDSTSVGFSCDHICSICGSDIWKWSHWFGDEGFEILAKNIEFHELSIVAIPADSDASVKINLSAEDKKHFEELKLEKEKRRTHMSDLQDKLNKVTDDFAQFKIESADEITALKKEFQEKKEALEADKADKDTEIFGLKNQIETLQNEKASLEKDIEEFKAKFTEIENERLSGLRAQVAELNQKAGFGLTEEEIADMGELALNRYVEGFTKQLKNMTQTVPVKQEKQNAQYQHKVDESATMTENFMSRVRTFRGF